MLQLRHPPPEEATALAADGEGRRSPRQEIPLRLSGLRRQRWTIFSTLAVFLLLAAAYLWARPASYEAMSQLLVDHQVLQLTQQDVMFATSSLDAALVQNQVSLLTSRMIALRVVDNLGLADDPYFQRIGPGLPRLLLDNALSASLWAMTTAGAGASDWAERLQDALGSGQEELPTEDAKRHAAVEVLQRNVSVRGVGASHTIEVRYADATPERAAAVVNELVRVYLEDQAESNARAAQSASAWLRERLSTLGTHARVITEAVPPTRERGPGPLVILAASAVAGLMFGAAGAWLREAMQSNVRLPDDAAALARADFLGVLPRVHRRARMVDVGGHSKWEDGGRAIRRAASTCGWALDRPLSQFAHTLRRILAAAEAAQPKRPVSLGITSTLPGEGRTLVAANLARVAAASGRRVLVIDADPYKPDLSRLFGLDGKPGLVEVLAQQVTLGDCVWTDPRTELHVLPCGGPARASCAPQAIWLANMERMLQEAYGRYDYVVLDLPPLAPVPDIRAAAEALDSLLLVLEWNRVPAQAVASGMAYAGSAQQKMLGVVFTKATPKQLRDWDVMGERSGRASRHYVCEQAASLDVRTSARSAGGEP